MFKMMYETDPYQREFDAVVESVSNSKYIVLSDSAFYPKGGGQPHDMGFLSKDDTEYKVVYVGKFSGKVSHEVEKEGLQIGDKVHGVLDWGRRHTLMRSHTAGHILSAVVHEQTGAEITGNQLELEHSRIDFNMESFDRGKIKEYENGANEIIKKNLSVSVTVMPRSEALEIPSVFRLAKGFLKEITDITVVKVEGVDEQACGGTHVKNTSEIGGIEVFKAENKGKNNRRIYYKLKNE